MAKECTDRSSVATSSSTQQPNWWDLNPAASSLSSWTSNNTWAQQQNHNSNSSCEDEVSNISSSFSTYASNHSGLTVESSHRLVEQAAANSSNEFIGEHAPDNQLWNHVLLSVGNNGDIHNNQDVRDQNILEALSSKSVFEPACDYLKKMDNNNNNWEFTNTSTTFNNLEKQLNGFSHESLNESQRLNRLSNLVSHWSIAPPEPELNRHPAHGTFSPPQPQTCDISLNSSMDNIQYSSPNIRNPGLLSYYDQDFKVENDDIEPPTSFFRNSYINSNLNGLNGSSYNVSAPMVEADSSNNSSKYYYGMPHSSPPSSSARNFWDCITLSSRLTKPLIDVHIPRPYFKSLNLSDNCMKKQAGIRTSPPTRMSGKERGISSDQGKKKRSEENSEAGLKKSKTENSTASSLKMQAPKVKLADRITALQQIVSPFGKTDTASVLYEAIGYIKFLQEQVQLLSNPYMKSNSHKDPWGGLERKEKLGDHNSHVKIDLRSRGLCLVPISCTPKVYQENTGSDYWTPAYRGCLYR